MVTMVTGPRQHTNSGVDGTYQMSPEEDNGSEADRQPTFCLNVAMCW